MSSSLAFLIAGLLAVFFLVGAVLVLLRIFKMIAERGESQTRLLMDFQNQVNALQNSVKDQVLAMSKQMGAQLEQQARFLQSTQEGYGQAVGQVQHRLGELQEATRSMMEVGKDIASLNQILQAPKLRGELGELFLGELLGQILPAEHYALQYGFRDGTKVDAVIIIGQGLIPVDAKFPLENFKRILEAQGEEAARQARKSFVSDVKKHIDDIAAKYIVPAEGTYEFALMYIPAENVYYETIIKDEFQSENISSYAIRKKVIPVSPNSFYAYLQAIVRGLKGFRIERSAQLILEKIGQLESQFKKGFVDFEKIGAHLSNAQSAYARTLRHFERFQDQLETVEGRADKPQIPGETVKEPRADETDTPGLS